MSSRMHSVRNAAAAAAPPLVHGSATAKGGGAAAVLGGPRPPSATSGVNDQRAKTILKEAVDAVVNSFAKHTQGYGRGESNLSLSHTFFFILKSIEFFTK